MPFHNRQRSVAVALLTGLLLATAPSRVRGAAAPPVGTRVVIKAGAVLKVGDEVVDTGRAHHIYTVERVNGAWVWLNSGAVKGWAQVTDVIPFDQALELYNNAINHDPKAAWAYFRRGLIRHDQRDLDKAIADYSEAIRIDPKHVPALINRGNVWMARRELDKAIADYSEAIRLDPKDILARVNRGIAWQSKREFDKAIVDYDEAIMLGLETPSAYNNRGHVWELKKDYGRAMADYTEAIRLNPRYSLAFLNRGNVRQTRGDYEKALADYAEAIRLDPKSPWGYARRAWILATCPEAKYRDGEAAVELAVKATELGGPKDVYLCEVRAAAHAEAGEFDQAVAWQKKAMEAAANVPGRDHDRDRARLALYEDKRTYTDVRDQPRNGGTSTR